VMRKNSECNVLRTEIDELQDERADDRAGSWSREVDPDPPTWEEIAGGTKRIWDKLMKESNKGEKFGTGEGPSMATRIMGNLFASGDAALQSLRVSRFLPPGTHEWKITRIISCMDTQLPPELDRVPQVCFRAKDLPWYPMLVHVKEVFEELDQMAAQQTSKNEACLIQCREGTNRSVVLALAVKIQQHMQRRWPEVISDRAQQRAAFSIDDCEDILFNAWYVCCLAAGKTVVTNVGFQRQLYMWTRYLCLHEKYVRSTIWPRSWGPELWLPTHPLSAEMRLALKQFRQEKESMTHQHGGATPQRAFVVGVWETASYMQEINSIRILRSKG